MNRFDIVEAWYCFLCDYHEGQWSEKYRRLSKMLTYFTPRQSIGYNTLSDDGKVIYANLVARNIDKTEYAP